MKKWRTLLAALLCLMLIPSFAVGCGQAATEGNNSGNNGASDVSDTTSVNSGSETANSVKPEDADTSTEPEDTVSDAAQETVLGIRGDQDILDAMVLGVLDGHGVVYDDQGRIIYSISLDENGDPDANQYDKAYEYDDAGHRIAETGYQYSDGELMYVSSFIYAYDEDGNIETISSNSDGETHLMQIYGYDSHGTQISCESPAMGERNRLFTGWEAEYNEAGQLIARTLTRAEGWPEGENLTSARYEYKYNEAGQLAEEWNYTLVKPLEEREAEGALRLSSIKKYFYDDAGKCVRLDYSSMQNDTVKYTLTHYYEYNDRGELEWDIDEDGYRIYIYGDYRGIFPYY